MNTFRSLVHRGVSFLGLAAVLFAVTLPAGCQPSKTQEQTDPAKRQEALEKHRQLHQMERSGGPAKQRK